MTEHEWLEGTDPDRLLLPILATSTPRKLRLFACACCWRRWSLLDYWPSRVAVDVAEKFADGKALIDEMQEASFWCRDAAGEWEGEREWAASAAMWAADDDAKVAALNAARCAAASVGDVNWGDLVDAEFNGSRGNDFRVFIEPATNSRACVERTEQARLVRDIFGNPFRPGLPRCHCFRRF
jgi:hypothetical protein